MLIEPISQKLKPSKSFIRLMSQTKRSSTSKRLTRSTFQPLNPSTFNQKKHSTKKTLQPKKPTLVYCVKNLSTFAQFHVKKLNLCQ